ncbi:MAG: toll/interleukin-1 receptor domain-containing protein [Candidatus Tumulicola sp.]
MPRWAVSIGLLAGVYAAVMTAAALWMPHEWDWQVLRWLGSRVAPSFSQEVAIVDVAWTSDVASNRRRIASFLDGLVRSNQRPNAVILDVEFDPCQSKPCGAPMASARKALITSIRAATKHFPVYATEEPGIGRDDVVSGPLDPKDAQIYGAVSGAAQTRFTSIPNARGLFYRVCYADVPFADESGKVQGVENVWAMAVRVLMTPRVFADAPPCDASHIPVRFGPKVSVVSEAVYKFTDARRFSHYAQFDDKMFVIVGTVEQDHPPFTDRSGPELLGWALSNALDQGSLVGKAPYYDVQPHNAMLLMLVPAFSGLAILAYVALSFQLKRTRLGTLRHLAPWFSAGLAAVVGLTAIAAFEIWLLLTHHIAPQVSLIALGVVLASGLSGLRGHQQLLEEGSAIDPAPVETYDYDVFISYAHEEGAWVFEHVFVPFRDARLVNGNKLSLFFDTSSIRAGTAWQTALSSAINASRFIVPVYSEVYFKQPYCRFEVLRAHRKWVLAGDESRCVLPVMRGHPQIFSTVDDIQALSIDDYPDLVRQHVAEIVDRLSRESASTVTQQKGSAL